MALIYITGPAGIGKTTVTNELKRQGYTAHDADDELCGWYDNETGEKVAYPTTGQKNLAAWEDHHSFNFSEKLTHKLAIASEGKTVFICGNALGNDLEIADKFFDKIICLVASEDTMVRRIKTRTGTTYGKDPTVLALLRRDFQPTIDRYKSHGATTVNSDRPVELVVADILEA